MSRFIDHYDDDSPEAVLNWGRWQHNARAALKGKRGRKALAELREALMALPEHRLIDGALCTVGDVDKRLPAITDEEMAREAERAAAWMAESGHVTPGYPAYSARRLRENRDEERAEYSRMLEAEGQGVCAIGAILWHRKVSDGTGPVEAFESLPLLLNEDGLDGLDETAALAKQEAGLTYTLAWELAYRNDETFRAMTPEERHAAFIAWIDEQLASETQAA